MNEEEGAKAGEIEEVRALPSFLAARLSAHFQHIYSAFDAFAGHRSIGVAGMASVLASKLNCSCMHAGRIRE
jgi:hypothetical protein